MDLGVSVGLAMKLLPLQYSSCGRVEEAGLGPGNNELVMVWLHGVGVDPVSMLESDTELLGLPSAWLLQFYSLTCSCSPSKN